MNPDCIEHILNDAEREFFNTQGYLVVENALDPEMCERLIGVLDRVDERERTESLKGRLISVPAVMGEHAAPVGLVHCRATLSQGWGMLGWSSSL